MFEMKSSVPLDLLRLDGARTALPSKFEMRGLLARSHGESERPLFEPMESRVLLTASAAPGGVDLLSAYDMGWSDHDDRTNLDNSSYEKTLQFQVNNTIVGATVKVYLGPTLLGSAIATGTTTIITTNGTADIPDGTQVITTSQVEPGKTESPRSLINLSLIVDTLAPSSAPDALVLQAGSDTGFYHDDNLTSDNTPSFSTGLPDDPSSSENQYCVYDNGKLISTSAGATFTPQNPLSDGEHRLQASWRDLAGNESRSATTTITVDTLAPEMFGGVDTSNGPGGSLTLESSLTSFGLYYSRVIAVQPTDGKLVVAGGKSYLGSLYQSHYIEIVLVRLNADGQADTEFGDNGLVRTGIRSADSTTPTYLDATASALAIQSDGKIVVAGYNAVNGMIVARCDSSGIMDTTFGDNGRSSYIMSTKANAMMLQNEKIVLAGSSSNDFAVVRLLGEGAQAGDLDTSFNGTGKKIWSTGAITEELTAVAVSGDKIVVAGTAQMSGISSDFAVARLNDNGSFDNTFDTDGKQTISFGTTNSLAYAVKVQPDGAILVGGTTYVPASNNDFALARLTPQGALDTSFGESSGQGGAKTGKLTADMNLRDDRIMALELLNEGRILAAGIGDDSIAAACFTAQGQLDDAFSSGLGKRDFSQTDVDIYDEDHVALATRDGKLLLLAPDNVLRLYGDTYAPHVRLDLNAESDSGVNQTDNITNSTSLVFDTRWNGYYRVTRYSTVITSDPQSGSTFVVNPAIGGSYAIAAVDVAGNESDYTTPLVVTVDTTAPAAPTAPDLQDIYDTGRWTTDGFTNSTTLVFDVAASPYFRFYQHDDVQDVRLSDNYATGSTFSRTAMTDGDYVFGVSRVDEAGNESAKSYARVVVDTVAPVAPDAPDLQEAYDSGVDTTDNITNSTTVVFDVAGDAYFTFVMNGSQVGTMYNGGSVFPVSNLAAGTYVCELISYDVAGNSTAGSQMTLVVDTSSPTATVTNLSQTQNYLSVSQISIQFSDDVSASLNASDLVWEKSSFNPDTETFSWSETTQSCIFSYDTATNTATWTLTNSLVYSDASESGRYRVRLSPSSVTDNAGNSLNGDGNGGQLEFQFIVAKGGDANYDGVTDVGDLGILGAHYPQTSGGIWEIGDFNFDGAIDVGDQAILAFNWD